MKLPSHDNLSLPELEGELDLPEESIDDANFGSDGDSTEPKCKAEVQDIIHTTI